MKDYVAWLNKVESEKKEEEGRSGKSCKAG